MTFEQTTKFFLQENDAEVVKSLLTIQYFFLHLVRTQLSNPSFDRSLEKPAPLQSGKTAGVVSSRRFVQFLSQLWLAESWRCSLDAFWFFGFLSTWGSSFQPFYFSHPGLPVIERCNILQNADLLLPSEDPRLTTKAIRNQVNCYAPSLTFSHSSSHLDFIDIDQSMTTPSQVFLKSVAQISL